MPIADGSFTTQCAGIIQLVVNCKHRNFDLDECVKFASAEFSHRGRSAVVVDWNLERWCV